MNPVPPSREFPVILLAMPYLTVGGAEASVSRICRRIRQQGCRIFVVTTRRADASMGDSSAWFEGAVDAIYRLPESLEDVSLWPGFILSLIRRESVDVLWQVGSSYVYSLLPEIRGLFPHVAVVDLLFNPVGHAWEHRWFHKFIDHIVVEHGGMKAWLLDRGTPARNVSVIPNGVDLDEYSPRPRLDWRTRAPRPAADDRFVAAFIGRLSEEKGPDIFVDVAAELAGRARMEFLVCGAGPMAPELLEMASRRGLNGRIHFVGRVSTRDFLPCCDAVVVCSRVDGRPNVIMESLAMGVPVVASRVGDIPGLLPEGQEDLLCEAGEVPSLAAAVRNLAEDARKRREYSVRARLHAEEHFSMARIGESYVLLFEELRTRRQRSAEAPRRIGWAARLLSAAGDLALLLKSLLKNACLVLRLRRSGAWAGVVREFDQEYYIRKHPKVQKWKAHALLHYVFWGFRRGYDPSPRFNTYYYMSAHLDVAKSGFNPLLHYFAFGRNENRESSAGA